MELGGVREAQVDETPDGRVPAEGGWWALNVADMAWRSVPGGGTWSMFESPAAPSSTLGIGIHVLWPGDSPGMYHAEDDQEGFLVLAGECLALVEGEERRLGPWDYLHCPAGTAHITIGAGDGPCALLMVGTRHPGGRTRYLVDAAAARHGASVTRETSSSAEAYADSPPPAPAAAPFPFPRW